jgi:hypothetical protein
VHRKAFCREGGFLIDAIFSPQHRRTARPKPATIPFGAKFALCEAMRHAPEIDGRRWQFSIEAPHLQLRINPF